MMLSMFSDPDRNCNDIQNSHSPYSNHLHTQDDRHNKQNNANMWGINSLNQLSNDNQTSVEGYTQIMLRKGIRQSSGELVSDLNCMNDDKSMYIEGPKDLHTFSLKYNTLENKENPNYPLFSISSNSNSYDRKRKRSLDDNESTYNTRSLYDNNSSSWVRLALSRVPFLRSFVSSGKKTKILSSSESVNDSSKNQINTSEVQNVHKDMNPEFSINKNNVHSDNSTWSIFKENDMNLNSNSDLNIPPVNQYSHISASNDTMFNSIESNLFSKGQSTSLSPGVNRIWTLNNMKSQYKTKDQVNNDFSVKNGMRTIREQANASLASSNFSECHNDNIQLMPKDIPEYTSATDEENDLEYILDMRKRHGLAPVLNSNIVKQFSFSQKEFPLKKRISRDNTLDPFSFLATAIQYPDNRKTKSSWMTSLCDSHNLTKNPFACNDTFVSDVFRKKRGLSSIDYRHLIRQAKYHPCKWIDYFEYTKAKKADNEDKDYFNQDRTPQNGVGLTAQQDTPSVSKKSERTYTDKSPELVNTFNQRILSINQSAVHLPKHKSIIDVANYNVTEVAGPLISQIDQIELKPNPLCVDQHLTIGMGNKEKSLKKNNSEKIKNNTITEENPTSSTPWWLQNIGKPNSVGFEEEGIFADNADDDEATVNSRGSEKKNNDNKEKMNSNSDQLKSPSRSENNIIGSTPNESLPSKSQKDSVPLFGNLLNNSLNTFNFKPTDTNLDKIDQTTSIFSQPSIDFTSNKTNQSKNNNQEFKPFIFGNTPEPATLNSIVTSEISSANLTTLLNSSGVLNDKTFFNSFNKKATLNVTEENKHKEINSTNKLELKLPNEISQPSTVYNSETQQIELNENHSGEKIEKPPLGLFGRDIQTPNISLQSQSVPNLFSNIEPLKPILSFNNPSAGSNFGLTTSTSINPTISKDKSEEKNVNLDHTPPLTPSLPNFDFSNKLNIFSQPTPAKSELKLNSTSEMSNFTCDKPFGVFNIPSTKNPSFDANSSSLFSNIKPQVSLAPVSIFDQSITSPLDNTNNNISLPTTFTFNSNSSTTPTPNLLGTTELSIHQYSSTNNLFSPLDNMVNMQPKFISQPNLPTNMISSDNIDSANNTLWSIPTANIFGNTTQQNTNLNNANLGNSNPFAPNPALSFNKNTPRRPKIRLKRTLN